jgi:Zn2+/Cd2+-exporting ATPase
MNILMTIACIGAIMIGEWMEASTVAFLFSYALVLENWSVGRARNSITSLLAATPDTARAFCPHDKIFEERAVDTITPGTLIHLRPGERVPLYGIVEQGESYTNLAPITGESIPVEKQPSGQVYAGSVNGVGPLEIQVTKTSEHSILGRIMKLIEESQAKRSSSEQWVEGFA